MNCEPSRRHRVDQLIREGILEVGDGYRAKRSELSDEGIPFARAGNVDGGFHFEGADLLGWDGIRRAGEKVAKPGDVVFTSKGTVGRLAWVRADTPKFVYSPQLSYWRSLDPEELNPRYLYYWMRGQSFQEQVGAVKGQTDMADYVSLRDQRRMLLRIPEAESQVRIASTLGALDDKIELNREVSRTLEDIAQTLFRSWFVDFEGRTDLVESELGPIPRGWSVAPIGELVETVGGGTPSTKEPEYWEGGEIHWTTPRDLSGLESPVLLDTARKITEAGLAKISSGLLPEGTVLLSSRAPIGYTAIAQIPVAVNQGYIAIPPGGRLSSFYALFWLRENMEGIKNRAGGTTFQEISKKSFRPMLAIKPPEEAQERFDDVVNPLFERIVLNEHQSRTLAELRDALLPKLISGEIRVPEAQEALEEAV